MKRIIILGLSLLVLAGLIVVLFKGFNLEASLERHETIHLSIGEEFELKDVKSICKEVFDGQKVNIIKADAFEDGVNINVASTITNEQKEKLVSKTNEKYGTEIEVEDVEIRVISNIKLRDLVKPYILPICIVGVLIAVYLLIIFRKNNPWKIIGKAVCLIAITEAVMLSIIAITRIPLSPAMFNILILIGIIILILYTEYERKRITVSE